MAAQAPLRGAAAAESLRDSFAADRIVTSPSYVADSSQRRGAAAPYAGAAGSVPAASASNGAGFADRVASTIAAKSSSAFATLS